jgi:hypothetical protein
MKTLSVRFRFVVLGVIAIVALVSCYTFNFPLIKGTRSCFEPGRSYVEIGQGPRATIPTYVEWKDEGAKFKQALDRVRGRPGGSYCICVIEKPGGRPHQYPNSKCSGRYECPPGNIRTVKVTKSKAADNIAAGESVVNDPNVTYRVQSPDPSDIIAVLDALK